MKTIGKRLLADPIFVVYVVGKKTFGYWVAFFVGTTLGILTAKTPNNQNILETIHLSLIMCLVMPATSIFFFAVLFGKENFFYEVEDLIHVVRPNFSFQKKNN